MRWSPRARPARTRSATPRVWSRFGDADVMVAGGAESPVCRLSIGGLRASQGALHPFQRRASAASRPYDRDRDGFVMGEGAGVVVLEEREHALARGATIYGEVVGYGLSGDAYHITAPAPGWRRRLALHADGAEAGRHRDRQISTTSTPTAPRPSLATRSSCSAVERLVGDAAEGLTMSSTKSATGHLLGAAGAVEAIFSLLAIRDTIVPPTLNLDNPSVETAIDLVPRTAEAEGHRRQRCRIRSVSAEPTHRWCSAAILMPDGDPAFAILGATVTDAAGRAGRSRAALAWWI